MAFEFVSEWVLFIDDLEEQEQMTLRLQYEL
jgi:hypothetical protein